MKKFTLIVLVSSIIISCDNVTQRQAPASGHLPLQGTWKLIFGTTIQKNDTTVTDYLKDKSFIKVINDTHFAFLGHDLAKGQDTAAFFSCGGGTYRLNDSAYTEHLEYCNAREWEGNNFNFIININDDTLTQQGIEKIDSLGIDRINIEKYVRIKN